MLLDAATGAIEHRFDLAENDAVPSTYPGALQLSKDGRRAFVALWNASEVVELDLTKHAVGRKLPLLKPASPVAASTHPAAFALTSDGKTLYVALANRDAVAAINVQGNQFSVKGYFDTRLPGQSYFGAEPLAVALNGNGSRLYVADMASDAVAVIDTRKLTGKSARQGMVEPDGFIPTEWLPFSMTFLPSANGGTLYVATAKGQGTGPNNFPQKPVARNGEHAFAFPDLHRHAALWIAGLDPGIGDREKPPPVDTRMRLPRTASRPQPRRFSSREPARAASSTSSTSSRRIGTYDQVLGDLQQDGKPVGNGDPSLTMYGAAVTPNIHKLALQFGVLDNFFDSGEVSGDGHVWSTAAIGTSYLDTTWQQSYRGGQRNYDYEGVVSAGYPLLQKIPDVNEPTSGYLWGDLAAHGKSYYHFGEYISTVFCGQDAATNDPQLGPMLAGHSCAHKAIAPGEKLYRPRWGGGVNKWPWAIPLIAANTATKPELVGHFAEEAPDFNLMVPDPGARRHLQPPSAGLDRGQAAGQRHDAELRDAAPRQ